MQNHIFTICTKNYIGLAKTLEASVHQFTTSVSFHIFIIDEFTDEDLFVFDKKNIISAKTALKEMITEDKWYEMAFKYNVLEFCCALRPFCFQYIFSTLNAEKIIFLDSDILALGDLNIVFSKLNFSLIILTPHITNIGGEYANSYERSSLVVGTFNGGFVAMNNSPKNVNMLQWWSVKLEDECFNDSFLHLYADQKWLNLLPGVYDSNELSICKDLGWNFGHWSYTSVIVENNNAEFWILDKNISSLPNKVKLLFAHFSNLDYLALFQDKFIINMCEDNLPIGLINLLKYYKEKLVENHSQKFIHYAYTYNFFDNQTPIFSFQRRFYNALISRNDYQSNPFLTATPNSFYQLMKRKKMLDKTLNNSDKVTFKQTGQFDRELYILNWMTWILKKIIGIRRYMFLIRFLPRYAQIENQIHLLGFRYFRNNVKK